MSTPLFFCETHLYRDEARDAIRPVLAAYKKVRGDIYRGLVHPIGQRPDGSSWTGFECELPEEKQGYFTIFREPGNLEKVHPFSLPHLAGKTLRIDDLLKGERRTESVDAEGKMAFSINQPGDFRFLSYSVQ